MLGVAAVSTRENHPVIWTILDPTGTVMGRR